MLGSWVRAPCGSQKGELKSSPFFLTHGRLIDKALIIRCLQGARVFREATTGYDGISQLTTIFWYQFDTLLDTQVKVSRSYLHLPVVLIGKSMNNVSVRLVFDRKHKATKNHRASVQMEVTFMSRRKFVSTGIRLYSDQWGKDCKVKNHPQSILDL